MTLAASKASTDGPAEGPVRRPLKIMQRVADLAGKQLAELGSALEIPPATLQDAADAANEGRDVWIVLGHPAGTELLIGRPRMIDALARRSIFAVIDMAALVRQAKAKG